MKTGTLIAIAACGSALLAPGIATAAPIIADGSFETVNAGGYTYNPTGSPWTFTGNSGLASNGGPFYAGNAPDGTQAAFLQSASVTGQITQVFSTALSNAHYTLSFYAAARPGYAANPIDVVLDGVDLGTFTPASTSFVKQSVDFVFGGVSHTLAFIGGAAGGDIDSAIDLVTITPTTIVSTPEPTALALLGVGGVALAVLRRRRAI